MSGLRIEQQNCRKSKTTALSLINMADPAKWDVILVQEPYISPNSTLTIASQYWNVVYLPSALGDPIPPSSLILINANLSSNHIQQVPLSTNLITAITFHPDESSTPLTILNIYNPPNMDSVLALLDDWLSALLAPLAQMVVAGDFNKHHLLWSGVEHPQHCRDSGADRLSHIISQYRLTLTSPCGVPTYQSDAHRTWSTLDLVLCTANMEDRILECHVAHADRLPGADHLPVHIVLETFPQWSAPVERCSFEKVDWPAFIRMLTQHLQDEEVSANLHIDTAEDLDKFVDSVTQAIQAAIERHAPKIWLSPFAKWWWTSELTRLRRKYAKCSHVEFSAHTGSWSHAKQECTAACNAYNSTLH